MMQFDLLIVGAGAAGIAAAKSAVQAGCRSILLADRRSAPGGILRQCAHRGFGDALTGPEFTETLLRDFPAAVECRFDTTVLSVSQDKTAILSSPQHGVQRVYFRQLILATGCMEIPLGALPIAGTRPQGVYTAGQAQELLNLHGILPEGPVVILGTGDLGLIMAAQLAQAGIEIAAMIEQKPACGGLAKNRRALQPYSIPLHCNATVTEIFGDPQLETIRIRCADTGEAFDLPCKTLLIAAGLRPDRTLCSGLASPDWLHLCGNCASVHPMVDGVVQEGTQAGICAWKQIRGAL